MHTCIEKLRIASAIGKWEGGDRDGALAACRELAPSLDAERDFVARLIVSRLVQEPMSQRDALLSQNMELLSKLPPSGPLAQRDVLAQYHAISAFEAHAAGDRGSLRAHAFQSLVNKPLSSGNRGLFSILVRSFAGSADNRTQEKAAQSNEIHDTSEVRQLVAERVIEVAGEGPVTLDSFSRLSTDHQIYRASSPHQVYFARAMRDHAESRVVPLLRRAFAAGMDIPEILLYQAPAWPTPGVIVETSVQGEWFDPQATGSDASDSILRDVGRNLAVLHAIPCESETGPEQFDAWFSREEDRLLIACMKANLSEPALRVVARAMDHIHDTPGQYEPVYSHRGLTHENILTTQGKVNALLDWEWAALDDRATDFADMLADLAVMLDQPDWEHLLDQLLFEYTPEYRPNHSPAFRKRVIARAILVLPRFIADPYDETYARKGNALREFLCREDLF